MAPHSSTLAWKIPWTEEPGRLQSMGSLRVGHDSVTSLSLFTFMHWRRKWHPTPVFLPGESQGRRSLVGCRLWGRTESDTTEAAQQQQHICRKFLCCSVAKLCRVLCHLMDCSTLLLSPRVCSDACPLNWRCCLTTSFSVTSFCLQSFPVSGSFPMSWLFTSCGQNSETSALASVLPVIIQGSFPLGFNL